MYLSRLLKPLGRQGHPHRQRPAGRRRPRVRRRAHPGPGPRGPPRDRRAADDPPARHSAAPRANVRGISRWQPILTHVREGRWRTQRVWTMRASPWPPPPHRAAAPRPPPRRSSSLSSVQRDAGARHADRVTEGDGAAVDVDDLVGDAEVGHRGHADGGERLVQLEQVDVADRQRRPGRGACLMARAGWVQQRRVGTGHLAVADDLAQRRRRRAPRPWPSTRRSPRRRRRRSARRCRR